MYAWLRDMGDGVWQLRLTAGRPEQFRTNGGLFTAMDMASALLRGDTDVRRQSTHKWERVGPEYCTSI